MKFQFFLSLLVFSVISISANAQSNEIVEHEISFAFHSDSVFGTLSHHIENTKFKKTPIVLIIAGSGPTDRNGNSIGAPGTNNSLKLLADSLSSHGIASYRYDKLGIAKSTFLQPEDSMNFEKVIGVAEKAVENLRTLGFKKIYVLGHSQGSLAGMVCVERQNLRGFISVAGAAESAFDVISGQISNNMPEGPMREQVLTKLDSINKGYEVTKYHPMLSSILRPSLQPFLRSYFAYTPKEEIAKLKASCLIIQGERDMQVTVEAAQKLDNAAQDSQLKLYPKMNHVLKDVDESDEQNLAAYTDPDFPMAKDLIKDLVSWIEEN